MNKSNVINHWNAIVEDEDTIIKDSNILDLLTSVELNIKAKRTDLKKVSFFYRGESENYGQTCLTPSVLRGNDEKSWYFDALTHFPQEFSGLSSLSKLAKMQHYTYPTRLLDLTNNPLVALWFACSDYSRYGAQKQKNKDGYFYIIAADEDNILTFDSDRALLLACLPKLDDEKEKSELVKLIYKLKQKYKGVEDIVLTNQLVKEYKEDSKLEKGIHVFERFIGEANRERTAFANYRTRITDLFSTFIVRPQIENERQKKQEGIFAIFGIQDSLYTNTNCFEIKRFRIPEVQKELIITQLDKLGINEATLFGDMESRANYRRFKKE